MDSSNTDTDCLIIGAGVAGLYTAYRLMTQTQLKRITILEKSQYQHGKIASSFSAKGHCFDLGAGRYLPHAHQRLDNLMNELGVRSKVFHYPVIMRKQERKYISNFISQLNEMKPVCDTSLSFYQILLQQFGEDEADAFCHSLGYDSLFSNKVSFQVGKRFINTLPEIMQLKSNSETTKWRSPLRGFSEITEKLTDKIIHAVDLYRGTECTQVKKHEHHYTVTYQLSGVRYQLSSKHVIFAMPVDDINQINLLSFETSPTPLATTPYELFKCYLEYDHAWFQDTIKQSTGLLLNADEFRKLYFSVENQYLFFYVDGETARHWHHIVSTLSESELQAYIKSLLAKVLKLDPASIPNPNNIHPKYWPFGVSHPEHALDGIEFFDQRCHVVSECYSDFRGWIEGSLQSADKLIEYIKEGE